jgi:hypothetical protein
MPSASFVIRVNEPPGSFWVSRTGRLSLSRMSGSQRPRHSIELHGASRMLERVARNAPALTPNFRIIRPILFQYRALTYVRLWEISQLP